MRYLSYFLLIAIAYVAGSLNSAIWITRFATGKDIRKLGDGNPGATNVFLNVDKRLGIAVGAIDIAKGYFLPLVGVYCGVPKYIVLLVALFVILGHDYPFVYGFRGGTGIAVTVGAGLYFAAGIILLVIAISILIMTSILIIKRFKHTDVNVFEFGESTGFLFLLLLSFSSSLSSPVRAFFALAVTIVVIRRVKNTKIVLDKINNFLKRI